MLYYRWAERLQGLIALLMCLNRRNTLLFDIIPRLLEDFSMQTACTLPAQQDDRTMPVRVTVPQKALRKAKKGWDEGATAAILSSAPHRTTLEQTASLPCWVLLGQNPSPQASQPQSRGPRKTSDGLCGRRRDRLSPGIFRDRGIITFIPLSGKTLT